MAVDNASNLIVGSDTIHDVSGTVEVDKIDSSGNVTVLYTNPTLTYSLTAASAASGGTTTTYAGTFSPTIPANSVVNISGFTNGVNNGQFTVVSCTSTQLVVNNPAGTAESNPGTATFQLTPASGTVTLTDSLTAASAASAGTTTTYTGTFSPTIPANSVVNISGFTMSGNNGQFTVVSCTSTQLVVNNPAGVAENNQSTATFQLTAPIGTVGGIAVFADGSIDVADFGAKSIFKITNPGTQSMAITTAVNGPAISPTALCCDISGMANPPSATNTTSLYVTLNGLSNGPQLQLAVPAETPSVTTVPSGAPLTFPKDVAWANLAPLPQPPKNLSAATAAASVVLTWNASPSNNVAYNVYRATVSVGPFTKLTPVPTTSLTFTDPVSSGTTYYYVVTAVGANSSLESAYSNEVSARRP